MTCKTRHIQKRMSQRGIRCKLLSLVEQFSVRKGDKLILNKKGTLDVIRELDSIKRHLVQIADTGGLVLIKNDDYAITTYGVDSYNCY